MRKCIDSGCLKSLLNICEAEYVKEVRSCGENDMVGRVYVSEVEWYKLRGRQTMGIIIISERV